MQIKKKEEVENNKEKKKKEGGEKEEEKNSGNENIWAIDNQQYLLPQFDKDNASGGWN